MSNELAPRRGKNQSLPHQLWRLQGARLPEAEQEWVAVKQALEHVEPWIVEGSSLDALLGDLQALAAFCEEWWDHRTKRDIHGGDPLVLGMSLLVSTSLWQDTCDQEDSQEGQPLLVMSKGVGSLSRAC